MFFFCWIAPFCLQHRIWIADAQYGDEAGYQKVAVMLRGKRSPDKQEYLKQTDVSKRD